MHSPPTPTLVHVGLWKTATTTLQRHVFPHVPGCTFVSRQPSGVGRIFWSLADNLCHSGDERFLGRTFHVFLAELAREGHPLLVSHEAFSGAPFERMYNRERNARRLAVVAPDAHILLVVRHQGTMLRSLYNYYVQRGGTGTFSEFVEGRATGSDFSLDALRYDLVATAFHECFGPDRVRILPYEMLATAPDEFLATALDVVGLEPPPASALAHVANRGISRPSRLVLRTANRLFRASRFNPRPLVAPLGGDGLVRVLQHNVDPHLPTSSRGFSADDEARIASLLPSFDESNRRLANLAAVPLHRYRYPGLEAAAPAPSAA